MPSGYPWSRSVRRGFFDRVCRGASIRQAACKVGVRCNAAYWWWRDAGSMTLRKGTARGLANPGDWSRPGGCGYRISFEERVEIMRGRDAGLNLAEIAKRIGRDRSVVWREVDRNSLPDGDYHALMAHAYATKKARRPKDFKLKNNPLCRVIEAWMDQGGAPS